MFNPLDILVTQFGSNEVVCKGVAVHTFDIVQLGSHLHSPTPEFVNDNVINVN